MSDEPKKIRVKLNKKLEPFGGLVDPDAKKNPKMMCRANYNKSGYMEVYETGFVRSRLESGELIKVEPVQEGGSGGGSGAPKGDTSKGKNKGQNNK